MKLRELVLAALLGGILFIQQVILSGLPNIHLCAVLIILYTLYFPRLVFLSVGIFILLEGVIYGFGLWWINYLYGFCFGALCSLPYFVIGGPIMAFNYWIAGIPFDILHGIGNIAVTALLWKPLGAVFRRLNTA